MIRFRTKMLSVLLAIVMFVTFVPNSVYAAVADLISENATESTLESNGAENAEEGSKEVYAIGEDVSKRTENAKYIRMSDGSYYVAMYDNAVHYQDENGVWQDIDNTLSDSSAADSDDVSGVATNKGKHTVKFANNSNSSKLVAIKQDKYKISFNLVGANKSKAAMVTNPAEHAEDATELEKITVLNKMISSVKYADILAGVDLEYVVSGNDVKENIIVKEKAEAYVYQFDMKLNKLVAEMQADGTIVLKDDKSGEVVYTIDMPYMFDANGEYSKEVTYTLEQVKNKEYCITVTADAEWINADNRAFPVTIDPPVGVAEYSVTDLSINSNSPSTNYNTSTTMNVSNYWKFYWKTNSLPSIPDSAYIVSATISLKRSSGEGHYVGAYQVISDWDSTLTWNDTISAAPEGIMSDTVLDYNHIEDTSDGWFTWNITDAVESWYEDASINYGIGFQLVSGHFTSSDAIFASSNTATEANRPCFSVVYKDIKGIESYWTYASHSVGLAGSGSINCATGNLVFSKALLSTTDNLMTYTPTLIYNSNLAGKGYYYSNAQTAIYHDYSPYGFKFNIAETLLEKTFISANGEDVSYYIFADADGTEHYFLPVDGMENLYKDEDGLGLTLNVYDDRCTITDSNKIIKTFEWMTPDIDVLSAWYLVSITDSNGNQIYFDFNDEFLPTSVNLRTNSGTVVKYLTISYNSSEKPYIIWNEATKEAIIFKYSSEPTGNITTSNTKYLRQIIYAHGSSSVTTANWLNYYNSGTTTNITIDGIASYTYDSNGYLIGASDDLSKKSVIYTNDEEQIQSVQEYGKNSSVGQKIGITYNSGYTDIQSSGTDDIYGSSDDIITRYIYDNSCRVVTLYSTNLDKTEIYGVTTGEYESGNTSTNNSLKLSTTTSSISANYLLNGSFENRTSPLQYWDTVGDVSSTVASLTFGEKEARLRVSSGTTSSISQYVYLREGEYTLSLDVDTFNCDDLTIKLKAISKSVSGKTFEEEVSYNRYYASGNVPFAFFTFDADSISNGGEVFQIVISVTGGTNTASNTSVSIDNVMLSKSNGAQRYNMVQSGDFEHTSVTSTGATRYSPFSFWTMSSDSASSTPAIYAAEAPFNKVMRLSGGTLNKQEAVQTVYEASEETLTNFDLSGFGLSSEPQSLIVSGFGKTTSMVCGSNAKFALRLDVTYYLGNGNTTTESKYFNFTKDIDNWQYVSGTFVVPEEKLISKIEIICEYSGVDGYAYFDDISVIHDAEGATTEYYYDDQGRTSVIRNNNDTIRYEYEDDGDLKEKITNKSRTVYTYDSNHRLLTEKYYKFSGYLAYLATYENMIAGLGTQTLKMSSSYTYDSNGLLTKSVVTTPSTSVQLVTTNTYYTTDAPRIFGVLKTTTDSLGKVTRYIHDTNNGRLLANIQPDNKGTCYQYDSLGNLQLVQPATYSSSYSTVSNSAKVQYQYNSLNQLSSLSTNGTTYTFTYDNFGNKNSVSIGGTTIVSQTYNSYNGKINTVTYANGTTVSYEYDKLDRVKTLTLTQNGVETKYEYEYDANGNLNKYIDHSSDIVTLYKYDLSGKMTGSIEYDAVTMQNLSSADYNYNDESQLSSIYYRKDYIYNSTSYGSLSNYRNFQYNDFDNISRYDFASVYSSEKYTVIPNYDGHNRIDSKKVSLTMGSSSAENNLTYEYATNGTNGSVLITKYTSQINSGAIKTYQYTYDSANNNITKITDASGVIQYQYTYDDLGRLIREDNLDANRTYVYTYDSDGNILTKKTYGYTTASGTPSTTLYSTYSYTYGNSSWKDQLTSYRGYSLTYDSMGNPLSYYNGNRMYFTWSYGTNLATVGSSSSTPHTYYTYNDGGIRTSKIVNGVEHRYMLDGSMILSEEYGDKLFVYVYDENGAPIGVKYRESDYAENVFDCYLYEKNLQGDIIGIYNADGTQVVWYSYDAWGNNYYGAYLGDSEGKYEAMCYANPFRYRGYYWDSETGFYYCGSRYYDPAIGRFINADTTNTLLSTAMSLTDKNLYAYCDNNPVMRVDDGGMFWDTVFDVVSLCFSVVDVIKNPDDPMAWVGLAADVVSLAVPFATGGGLIVDAVTKSDDLVDFAKSTSKISETFDKIKDGVKTLVNKITDCFVAGTLVASDDGNVAIETIKKGDYVWANNPETGETSLKQVVDTFVSQTTYVTHITVNGETITSTQTHPYYVVDKGWILAGNLRAGDILVMLNGEHVVLELVQHEILESSVTTYNFEVEDFHTYYVGEENVLVHNKCFRGDLMDATGYTKEMAEGFDAHHVFPQKFKDNFIESGFTDWADASKYGVWWDLHDHRQNAYAYNQAWGEFFKDGPRTKAEILDKGRKLMKDYSLDVRY